MVSAAQGTDRIVKDTAGPAIGYGRRIRGSKTNRMTKVPDAKNGVLLRGIH